MDSKLSLLPPDPVIMKPKPRFYDEVHTLAVLRKSQLEALQKDIASLDSN